MFRKLVLAVSAVVLAAVAITSEASAKVHVDLNLGVGPGYPVYVPQPYPVYPVYDGAYDDSGYDESDCDYEYRSVKKWNRYHSRFRIEHRRVWVCH